MQFVAKASASTVVFLVKKIGREQHTKLRYLGLGSLGRELGKVFYMMATARYIEG